MDHMARVRRGRTPVRERRAGPCARARTSLLALTLATFLLAGCTEEPPPDAPPDPAERSAPLRLTTVAPDNLGDADRTAVEGEVSELLSAYVVAAFLGDYPRSGFVRSFDDFTGRAAELATADLEVLTAAGNDDLAGAVRATRLDARLSFLFVDQDVLGATAHVRFGFTGTTTDGDPRRLTMTGRLMLERSADSWSIFGYDVASDNGAASTEDLS